MSNATEQARSSRDDARAFAAAFAEADDAFTVGTAVGESRTLTLTELEEVLELDSPVDLSDERPSVPAPAPADPDGQTELLTLAELGDALFRPPVVADTLDFDFGTGTAERARRRTAARSAPGTPAAPRRVSGPVGGRSGQAAPPRPLSDAPRALVVSRRPSAARPLEPRRRLEPWAGTANARPRPLPGSSAVQRFRADPDRIALYAVLLGILLVLIAASSSA